MSRKKKTKVMRIDEAIWEELQEAKGDMTYSQILGLMLATAKLFESNRKFYLSPKGTLYNNAADARGDAILSSMESGVTPMRPLVLLEIGEDMG